MRLPRLRSFILLAGLLALGGCSAEDVLNATIPREGYHIYEGIAYGSDARQKLNIYVPDGAQHAPVIVFYYGGSWKYGSRDDYRFLGQAFTSKGYIVAVVDYRLYPDIYFPTFLDDSAAAFTYVHDHIASYGGDARNLFIAGHSAGAYNAMMLSADEQYLKRAGGTRAWIRSTIAISGPYDFLPFTDPDIIAVFSKVPDAETQPINHIKGKMPPVFLATGDEDDTVSPRNSHHVKAKLESFGSPVEEHIYPGVGHIGILLSLARGFRDNTLLREDIARFIDTHRTDKSN